MKQKGGWNFGWNTIKTSIQDFEMVDFHSQINYRKKNFTISSHEKFASTHPASTYRYQSTIMSCVNLGQFLGEYRKL